MSKIGEIRETKYNGETILEGFIGTLDIDIAFDLVKNPDQATDKAPDYLLQAKSRSGQPIQVGAAWKKRYSDNGIEKDMLTISLDDPSFHSPLNVAAFKDQFDKWTINFRRRQDRKNQTV